jgi:hypothetical protein
VSKQKHRGLLSQAASVKYHAPALFERLEARQFLDATGPTAQLDAEDITRERDGSYTFRVFYTDNDAVRVSTIGDNDVRVYGPRGYERFAQLMSVDHQIDGLVRVAKYKIAAPGGRWDVADDGLYLIKLRSAEVRDILGNAARSGVLGDFRVATHATGGAPGDGIPTQGVHVSAFGAIPDDELDDTDAIQEAIDSLVFGNGVPDGSNAMAGVVQFGSGTYKLTKALKLPSGVWLRGNGNATALKNYSSNRQSCTIELTSPYGHTDNVDAAVKDIQIFSYYAHGIRAGAIGDLVDLEISNVRLNVGGVGIDLRSASAFYTLIQNVVVTNPGSTALWIGTVDDWTSGASNVVNNFRVIGTARANFVAERGLIVLAGDTTFMGGGLEQTYATVVPLYVSGKCIVSGLWTEFPAEWVPDKTLIKVEDATYVYFDRLVNVDSNRRIKVVRSQDINIGHLAIEGLGDSLLGVVEVDPYSHLSIGSVYAQYDAGMFDDPRVTVRSAYNIHDGSLVENRTPWGVEQLLQDPTFTKWGQAGSPWHIVWGDNHGAVAGTVTIEQTSAGPRMKIVITSNPNNRAIALVGRIKTPPNGVNKKGYAYWRMDGSYQGYVYMGEYDSQFQARVMKSKTGARTPRGLRANDELRFLLPKAKGTYYIWKLGVVAGA